MKTYKLLLFLLALLSITSVTSQVPIENAVDFSVKDLNGNTHHLFNYLDNNKIVVIDFFTTNCGPCQTYASHVNQAYEYYGCNQGNVIFLGMNWGSDNITVQNFDSIWGAHYASISGLQGGGNRVVDSFQVLSYPTVIIITPDHLIANNYIWPPAFDSIVQEVSAVGGIPDPCTVSNKTIDLIKSHIKVFPNGNLSIDMQNFAAGDNQLSIYSIDGKLQCQIYLTGSSFNELIPSLSSGLYIVRLTSNARLIESAKIIVN